MKTEFPDGWFPEEHDGVLPFRWMSGEAACVPDGAGEEPAGGAWFVLTAGHSFSEPPYPRLDVFADGAPAGSRVIDPAFRTYLLPLGRRVPARVSLRLDRTRHVPGDPRPLGIMARRAEVVSPASLSEPLYGDGWFEAESDEFTPFHWLSNRGVVLLPSGESGARRFLTVPVFSEFMDLSQELTVTLGGRHLGRFALLNKWSFYSVALDGRDAAARPPSPAAGRPEQAIEVPSQAARRPPRAPAVETPPPDPAAETRLATDPPGPFALTLSLNKPFPARYHPGDARPLGARIGPLEFHDDEAWHRNFGLFHANARLNYTEMIEGRTELASFPTNLGIDLHGRCNIHPPCVYCLWHRMKVLEGPHTDAVVDEAALEGYGPFFRAARTLVNCSFGEPLLHPRFEALLDLFARNRKILELSTNGQAFTERTIRALAGRHVYLYVSLDAARAETYARIRNDRWDDVQAGLARLHEARKAAGGLPKIYMVFMPMRVNRDDLEDYFALCRRIEADALVLRPLLHLGNPDIRIERGGYLFDYARELLDRAEVEAVVARAEALSKASGVPLANQFDFGLIKDPGDREAGPAGSAGGAQ